MTSSIASASIVHRPSTSRARRKTFAASSHARDESSRAIDDDAHASASIRTRRLVARVRLATREEVSVTRSMTTDGDDASMTSREDGNARETSRDEIACRGGTLYPERLDRGARVFGRLNPLTALLLFYTGAMLGESREVPIIAAQWMVFVVVPAFGAWFAARRWRCARGETGDARASFVRSCRSAWVDFHVGYMLLVPAGAYRVMGAVGG